MPRSSESFLESDMGFLPAKVRSTSLLKKVNDLYEQSRYDLTPSKLRKLLDTLGLTMGEGKSRHHYEQEGRPTLAAKEFINLVMDQGYTDHELLLGEDCIGHIYLRRYEA